MAKFKNSELVLVEHYVYATAASAVILWERGGSQNHNLKHVLFAAIYGVIGPVLGKVNPWGLASKLSKQEHLSAPETAVVSSVITNVVADATKDLASAAGVTTPAVK